MTRVLVAFGTKMGSTGEIAAAVAARLTDAGMDVTLTDATRADDLGRFDAAVVGSALYAGRWRPDAVKLLTELAGSGAPIPVWLFQSGPCGSNAAEQVPVPKKVRQLAARLDAAPAVTFGGRLELATARGFIARRMAKGAMAGDYRDFDRIHRWAENIGIQLGSLTVDHR